MKKAVLIISGVIGMFVLASILLHTFPISSHGLFPHGNHEGNSDTITIRVNEPGFAICGQPFFDSVYELTKEIFSVGAENVVLSDYENQMFTLIRNSEAFKDDPEPFIEHIKGIPRETIDIVKEDSEVLESCENFQVAMVGPQ